MSYPDPAYATVTEVAAAIKERHISATEASAAAIDRIERTTPCTAGRTIRGT